MTKKYDVITIGSGTVDVFVLENNKEINKKIQFLAGSKIPLEDILVLSGGGGVNTASAMSKLGLKVGFLGNIGSGYNSEILLREIKKFGIDFLGQRDKTHTGYSIILRTDKNHRTILAYKGASNNLDFYKINLKKVNTKWFYFANVGGKSFETQLKLLNFAKKNDINIAFNPGVDGIKKRKKINTILKNTDLLALNLEEATLILRAKHSPREIIKRLHKIGSKTICLTDGENGGYVSDGINFYEYKPRKVKIVGTTGTGDAFASSFLTGLIRSYSIEDSIKLALVNSESVLREIGANKGLLSFRKAKYLINSGKFNIKKKKL